MCKSLIDVAAWIMFSFLFAVFCIFIGNLFDFILLNNFSVFLHLNCFIILFFLTLSVSVVTCYYRSALLLRDQVEVAMKAIILKPIIV